MNKNGQIDGGQNTQVDLINALDSVTWYNGLAPIIWKWKELPVNVYDFGLRQIVCPEDYASGDEYGEVFHQLQVIWMICVVLFGEYGTSPRYGWIEDIEGFYKFIDDITYSEREYGE